MVKKKVKKSAKRVVKKVKVLPKKLSALVKLALADMRKAEKVPEKYILALDATFHSPTEVVCATSDGDEIRRQPACVICAAGAVMAFTLKADFTEELSPSSMGRNSNQLDAIDSLRVGHVRRAYLNLRGLYEGDTPNEVLKVDGDFYNSIPPYVRDNPEPFHKAMTKLEVALRKANL